MVSRLVSVKKLLKFINLDYNNFTLKFIKAI